MCIFEFDEEKFLKSEREWAREEGIKKGEQRVLIKSVESVMKSFNVDLQKACDALGTSVEEYESAKESVILK